MGVIAYRKLLLPGVVFAAFWALAITFWLTSGYLQPLLLFGYIGTALALGLGLYAGLPRKKKQLGRRLTLILVGGPLIHYLMAILGHAGFNAALGLAPASTTRDVVAFLTLTAMTISVTAATRGRLGFGTSETPMTSRVETP